jgi:hypothetical protein
MEELSIILVNKSERNLYFSYDETNKLLLKKGETITSKTDKNVVNLFIYSNNPENKETPFTEEWGGAIPSTITIEIYYEKNKIELYTENEKIPPCVLGETGKVCKKVQKRSDINKQKSIYKYLLYSLAILILIITIISFIYFMRMSKKRRY